MTYIELIVVLSIFSVMTSVVLFSYGNFQAKIDIKNLASDIALKIVEAQKSSLSGKLPPAAQFGMITTTWKPSYGLYFNPSSSPDGADNNIPFNKKFIYFTDVNPVNNSYNGSSFCSDECIDKVTITKGNYIFQIDSYSGSTPTQIVNPLSVVFKRPSSGVFFTELVSGAPVLLSNFDYVQISIRSSNGMTAYIKIYPSGRIQVN